MKLTGAQMGLYNRCFAAVQAVNPAADRLAMHAELGLPDSRKDWDNVHLDEWKRACAAIAQPANLHAQLDGLGGAEIRCRFVIRALLKKLNNAPDAYAETIARRLGHPGLLETLPAEALKEVIVRLRLQVKRGKVENAECPF